MTVREHVPLASLTTLRVGGTARFVIECLSENDVVDALAFSTERMLPWRVLGEGSNVLARDEPYEGVILLMRNEGIEASTEGDHVFLTAGAGVSWDTFVREAAARELWGIENLAGIPGTVGAAPVQNIGAYGAEVKDTIHTLRVLDTRTGEISVLTNEACEFGYRDSAFKRDSGRIILSVTFALSETPAPSLSYKDLTSAAERGEDLSTPHAIGEVVRAIRALKFPDLSCVGTAGSFFKNPTVSVETYESLKARNPAIPGFLNETGVKIPLAFVLDKVLGLRGYTQGAVSLYDAQPLVLVARNGATAHDIDTFANAIAARVQDEVGIVIEREVQKLP